MQVHSYAVQHAQDRLAPFLFQRRAIQNNDLLIEILYCGVCHSDLHQVRNDWGNSFYPLVPGHEIVGRILKVGSNVQNFRVGDLAGVGCFVDSCRTCSACHAGEEQYCEAGPTFTYNSYERDGITPTYGGYSTHIVVDAQYALSLPSHLPLEGIAPLLCAGITTYSPLRHWKVQPRQKIGIIGLGGLGHMAVKWGVAFETEVTVFSTSASKEQDAKRLGAHHFVVSSHAQAMAQVANQFDFILDTVSAPHDHTPYLNALRRNGVLVCVGVPTQSIKTEPFTLIGQRRSIAGSLIGGIAETQEMLNFCGKHHIVADVEVIPIQKINEAYERMLRGDVKYRFVIDSQSLL